MKYITFKHKRAMIRVVFDSKHYEDLGNTIRITVPKGDLAQIHIIDKSNIYEIEDWEKKKKEKKVTNQLTQF